MGDIINIYGYMRVSSKEQNEDRQKIALIEMGGKRQIKQCIEK